MDIVDMPREVAVVVDGVLPKPPLQKCEIAIWPTLEMKARCNQFAAEMSLDPPPAPREIRVSRRQGENRVQMIRQDHDSIDRERTFAPTRPERRAHRVDVIHKGG